MTHEAEGYTARYNRINAGKAWAIVGYTYGGRIICPSCADGQYYTATLSGENGAGDNPAPLFSCDEYPIWACDTCAATIEGGKS